MAAALDLGAARGRRCDAVIVVLGCEAARARDLLANSAFAASPIITAIDAPDWQLGHGQLAVQRFGCCAAHSNGEPCWCTWSTCLT